MPYYSIDQQAFWDDVTPPKLAYLQEAGKASGFEVAALPLGDVIASDPPLVIMLKFEPNGVLIRHAHDCYRVEVLVSGSLTTPDGTILRAGAVMTSGPEELYGPHVAGPEGAVTAEIFSSTYARIDYDLSSANTNPESFAVMEALASRIEEEREVL